MKIGIDISTVLNHGKDIGAGRYTANLLKGLFGIDKKNTYILTGRYVTEEYLPIIYNLKSNYPDTKIKLEIYSTTSKKLDLWNKCKFPPLEFLGFRSDILHCPDFLIPPTLNKNIVLTIHDLSFIRYPEFNFDWFIKKYTREVNRNAKKASLILTDSKSTKGDIISFLKINPDKVKVIYLAAENLFKKLSETYINKEILKKYKIDKNYILSVGTIEPRKNFITLIKAFSHIKNNNPAFYYKLVIAGRTGWKSEATYSERELSPYKKDILFTGRVSDEDLVQLYNQAELFVYPSIFEGFGLPPLEAMSCGLPVIASNCPSLEEVIEDSGILLSPHDYKKFAEAIISILGNAKLKEKLSQKSLNQAAKFSWEKTAQKTLNNYLAFRG